MNEFIDKTSGHIGTMMESMNTMQETQRQLVEAQGGRIWAENFPDGGLVFSFSLPVYQEKYDL